MNIKTEIEPQNKLRRHKISGKITYRNLYQYLHNMYDRPQDLRQMDSLWDLREARFNEITADEVRSLVGFVNENWGKGKNIRSALVVSGNYAFGMARMYEIQLEQLSSNHVRVFRTLDDAENWLAAAEPALN